MITESIFTDIARSFSGAEQYPYFDEIEFKIKEKRMFATYLVKDNTANIFLTWEEQAVFCNMDAKKYLSCAFR